MSRRPSPWRLALDAWPGVLVVPAIVMALGLATMLARGPFWRAENQDPEYMYLFSALSLIEGVAPLHVDHPGTPLQLLGAASIRVQHALAGRGDLADDVLLRPEAYLRGVACWLLAVHVLTLVWVGHVGRSTGRAWAGPCLQAGALMATPQLAALGRVSPETLLLAAGHALGALLVCLPRVRPPGAGRASRAPLLLGALCGAAVATKLNFIPVLLVPLICVEGWRSRALFAAATAGAFAVGTFPVWGAAGRIAGWVVGLLTHKGRYGLGERGFVDPARFSSEAVSSLVEHTPFFLLVVVGVGAISARRRLMTRPPPPRLIEGCCAVILVLWLLVAKHPAPHYLVPAFCLTGALGWCLLEHGTRRVRAATLFAIAAGCLLSVARHVVLVLPDLRARGAEGLALAEARSRLGPDAVVLLSYRSSSEDFALFIGNRFAGDRYGRRLAGLRAPAHFVDIWETTVWDWAGRLPPHLVRAARPLLVQGTDPVTLRHLFAPRRLVPVAGEREALYEVVGEAAAGPTGAHGPR